MNFCLSDLVPPLRWSDAATIPLLREQPDLPDAWWRSLPMARVLAVLGPERLADILASVALNHWPAAAVGDVLPALHVLDPDDADEPYTAIALDRAGSWPGLLSLTGHDLRDQPFIQPVPLLQALFTAVFTRLAAPAHAVPVPAAHAAGAPASQALVSSPESAGSPEPAESLEVSESPEVFEPSPAPVVSPAPVAGEPAAGDLPVQDAPPVVAAPHSENDHAGNDHAENDRSENASGHAGHVPDHAGSAPGPEVLAEPVALPKRTPPRERDALPVPEARRPDAGPEEAPGSLFQPASARRNRPAGAPAWEERFAAAPEDVEAPEAGLAAEAGPGEPEAVSGGPEAPAGAVPAGIDPVPGTEGESGDDHESGHEADREDSREDDPVGAPVPADAPEPVAESDEGDQGDEAHRSHRDDEDAADREAAEAAGDAEAAGAVRPPVRRSLHALVDGVFANVEDKRWAVAQNRLFSDAPATVEALAKLFAVSPEVIGDIEADLRRELAEWTASDEATPYREHLEEVKGILGKAAPRERLINAAPWHNLELHSLDVPAWQFVLAGLPEYHLVDEWLVEGDITELRHRTRDMISGARPPLTINKALDMVSSLGIHPEVSKEWLENVPQLRILGAGERPPQRSNGAPALTVEKPPEGIGGPPNGGEPGQEPRKAPFRPLKDVSLTRRCFRQPDGRWWLRIDVTSEHLGGAECPLPSGFAAYLGMSPGDGRTVSSAVGELVLSWQDRPVLESLMTLLEDVGAKEGSHLFLTLSDEGVLRARHLPAAGEEVEATARALRLVGYTATGGTPEQAGRVIATRVGMTGPVAAPELLTRLRERGDRDLLSLLA
ncbi:hypothetical protein [Streptosporangium vulgare]|uniref:Helicase XPB/Ssl2 N-terminal domain-containing protein n=1 Tax=Streptosporangium vulgare TaxID=46190 RepID=A0ABV5TJ64_9ACTN